MVVAAAVVLLFDAESFLAFTLPIRPAKLKFG
jgi:hypothetical protein